MFVMTAKRRINWPVTVNEPQDGGTVKPFTFDAVLEILKPEETKVLLAAEVPERVLVGWTKGIVAEDRKTEIPFSDEVKAELLKLPYVRVGIAEAYYEASQGREAARKNS